MNFQDHCEVKDDNIVLKFFKKKFPIGNNEDTINNVLGHIYIMKNKSVPKDKIGKDYKLSFVCIDRPAYELIEKHFGLANRFYKIFGVGVMVDDSLHEFDIQCHFTWTAFEMGTKRKEGKE